VKTQSAGPWAKPSRHMIGVVFAKAVEGGGEEGGKGKKRKDGRGSDGKGPLVSHGPVCHLAAHARHCLHCICSWPGCEGPRYRGPYCKICAARVAALSGAWRLVHASRAFLHKMVPADVKCYATHFAEMRRDFAISVMAAKGKEPVFINALLELWRQSPADYIGADLRQWIRLATEAYAQAMDKPQEAAELVQLVARGAGRSHLGARALAADLGVIRNRPASGMFLSKRGAEYEFTETGEDLDAFLLVCRKFTSELGVRGNLADMLHSASKALVEAGQACKALMIGNPQSQGHKAVLRKIALGSVADGGVVDWEAMTMAKLREICPDEYNNLGKLDANARVADMSALILGRPDQGLLLSMWACLFQSAGAPSLACALEEKGEAAVDDWRASHEGVGPRPVDLCEQLAKRPKNRSAFRIDGE